MLGRTTGHSQHSDKECSERGARTILSFILQNRKYLDKVRNGACHKEAAINMCKQKEKFSPKQLSYIDGIYEKTMKGMGLPSFSPTYKPKRKF